MAPRYLANPVEEQVLVALDSFDRCAPNSYDRPLLVIDARDAAEEFRSNLGNALISALSDKVRNKNVEMVSGLGTRGTQYALAKLHQHHAQLDQETRNRARLALIDWQAGKAKQPISRSLHPFQSGIAIHMPVLGVLLHYDVGYAAELT